ncbi:MAG: FHA domain-containing protein [Myxococcales bacterium]|nr:MAG: FHA domain-containing protein [Myxococcales bacterium]
MADLTIYGPEGPQRHNLGENITLGRHPDNDIQVLDRIASKNHCRIWKVKEGYHLKDLDSLNGTLVNGKRASSVELKDGDEIMVGTTRIVFSHKVQFKAKKRVPQVTITPGSIDSHIHTRLAPISEQRFVSEKLIANEKDLRRDYEKLRLGYELTKAIGLELDVDKLLEKVLARLMEMFPADRGVVLLVDDESGDLLPRCVHMRDEKAEDEQLTISSTITNEVLRDSTAVLSSDATMDARFHGARSVIMQGIRSSMAVPLVHADHTFGVILLDSKVATNSFREKDLQLFQNVANQAAIAIQNSFYANKIEKDAVMRGQFERLLSPAIVEEVMSGAVKLEKGGQLRETTVLFTDIRGFTNIAENQSAQETVTMLNEYFELMVEVIFKHEGTLDKFVGDAIMALFGAPVMHDDDPVRAVRTAIEMQGVLDKYNAQRIIKGQRTVRMGIGINTGEVVAGYLGSSQALEYTVIGDVVNVGARLCSVAKEGEIIISESVYKAVKTTLKQSPCHPLR